MAKKKIVPEEMEQEVEMIEEVKVEKKNEEKPEVVSSKEKICEFYGIRDEELLSPERDLSKYNLKAKEEEVLLEWINKNRVISADMIKFDMYHCEPKVKEIIEKYGLTPKHVAENDMPELSAKEKDIMVEYYNSLVEKL
jgi:hypothetical protein